MAHNKLYRNFIILQEDEDAHISSNEKALSGYAKIEAKSDKCKISFYAQNLNRDDDYSIVLICYKKDLKQIVNLGPFRVKEEGKGEISKDYYINNIAGLDLSYEKISGAGVCRNKDGRLNFIMYGFINGESIDADWKKSKVLYHNDKNEEVVQIVKEEVKMSSDIQELEPTQIISEDKYSDEEFVNESIKASSSNKEHMSSMHKCGKDSKKEHTEEDKHKEHAGEKHKCHEEDKHKEHSEEKHKCYEDKDKEHEEKHEEKEECCKHSQYKMHQGCCHRAKNDDHDYCDSEFTQFENEFDKYEAKIEQILEVDPDNFRLAGAMGAFFEEVTRGFEECRHKFKDIKYCKWYKVNVNSIDEMCNISNYNIYTLAYYPMLNYYPYIKKHKHFIIGYKCDKMGNLKYVVYGVPGTKSEEDQPYHGKTGFVTWMNSGDDNMGYWLMFYDFKNSKIVYPSK